MDNFIELKGVSKSLGPNKIFQNLNLNIQKESSIGLFGPSGCGKTTLLHILGCLETKDEGIFAIEGEPVSPKDFLRHRQQTFGFIFQNFQLLKSETALNNVLLPALICSRIKTQALENLGKELLEAVGLKEHIHQNINTLSGGEKQRVAIARALIRSPHCLLADEPTGNLDEETKLQIFSLLQQTIKMQKKTLIMVTHDLSFIRSFDKTYTFKQKSLNLMES
jgi:ABC-type lipoprotein export system ATPase subunit